MNRNVYDPAVADRKQKNVEVFYTTLETIRTGRYIAPSGRVVELPPMKDMIDGSVCCHDELPAAQADTVPDGTEIVVENNDCIRTAQRLVAEGYNPAVLNFASSGHPGGGVETGARAQEETICRRSTLIRSIYSFSGQYSDKYRFAHKPGNNYPLDNLRHSVIYSPYVTFFREGLECKFMETPFQCAVITCAALNLNGRFRIHLTPGGKMPLEARSITADKIRAIFRVALEHGHDALVLGAFGCGAFENPPDEMADLFRKALNDEEFRDKFRYVSFSIIEDHNSRNRNLQAFRDVFEE